MNKRQAKKKIKKAYKYALISIDLAERMLIVYKIRNDKFMKIVKLTKKDIETIKILNYEIQHYMSYEEYNEYYSRLFQKLLKGEDYEI